MKFIFCHNEIILINFQELALSREISINFRECTISFREYTISLVILTIEITLSR